jgi:hypothetical protein
VAQHTELEQPLQLIENTLRRLETEYTMYFAGQLPRPPLDARRRLETMIGQLDRSAIANPVDRFRLGTLQSRYVTLGELWDRGLKAREEGRPGPFSKGGRAQAQAADSAGQAGAAAGPATSSDRVFGTATLASADADPRQVIALYDSYIEARKAIGAAGSFPFSRFSDIVRDQVAKFQQSGSAAVAFRVSVKDGRVVFTARGRKSRESDAGG